jgi:hypothetical protein
MNSAALLLPAIALVAYAQDVDRKLQNEFDELAAKASAVVETVNAMERRARDNGQSLHPDLIEQRALVRSSIDRAEEALRGKDMPALRERLIRARGHIERLNKML